MATSLNTSLESLYLSSALPDSLQWSTDQQEIWVQIYPGPWTSDTIRIIKTKLAAVDGVVTFYEFGELIQRYMRVKGLPRLANLYLQHSEDGASWTHLASLTVLFCEKNIVLPAGDSLTDWLGRNFLSTMTAKTLPSQDETVERLFFVQPQNTPPNPSLHVTYIDDEDNVCSEDITLQASYNTSQTNLFVCEFSIADIKAAIVDAVNVIAVTVSVGNRHMEYYRPSRRENVGFIFRNAFNVMESAHLSAVITRKTEDGRKLAHVNGKLDHYDRKPVAEYEVQTSPLSFEEANWIDQLITSPEVTLLDGTPLVITDGDAECHNDNAELNAAKFSYKELDQRHTINAAAPVANIFTVPPHSYQFD